MSMSEEFEKSQNEMLSKMFKKDKVYTGEIRIEMFAGKTYYKINHPVKSNIFIKNKEGLTYADNWRVVDFTLETVSMGQDYGGDIYIDYATIITK